MIVPIVKPNSGCDYHRIKLPMSHLGVDFDDLNRQTVASLFSKAKIVLYNRMPGFEYNYLLKFRRQYGFKIVIDIDDYWNLSPNSIHYKSWKAQNTTQKILEGLMNADFVFTTHSRLAEQVTKYNKNVEVVPNALPFGQDQFTEDRIPSEQTRFIYAGGVSHYWDLFSVRSVFDKLSRSNGNFQLQLAGYTEANEGSKKYWQSVEKIVTANSKIKSYERKNMLPLEYYMDHYSSADVSLAPLENTYFNSFKSNLKVLEAGCKNIPIVTSKQHPYLDDSEVISMAGSTTEWFAHLHRYIKNPSLITEDGQRLGEYVRAKFTLADANAIRQQVFDHLSKN